MGRKRVKHQPVSQIPVLGASIHQVLGCYELLHHVCTFMDIATLLNAQLVSKHWHDMISTSPLLQQILYLQPRLFLNLKQPRVANPLLLKHFEPIFKRRESLYRRDGILMESTLTVPGMSIANMKGGRKVHKAFIRRGASWRKMLVAQPPITSVGYMHRVVNRTREWRLLSFPAGLRMGELYDMVFQAIWSKPDDVSGYAYIELELNGFLDDSIQGMLNEWGKIPPLLVESVSTYYADQSCGKGRCCGHTVYTLDSMCFRLREEKVDIRACKSTRWMFKREEFEERNYLGPDQPRFTIS
ncbi:hypothetical protein FPOAC2_05701 [Fusarium poae]|jgi:hypothetical protein